MRHFFPDSHIARISCNLVIGRISRSRDMRFTKSDGVEFKVTGSRKLSIEAVERSSTKLRTYIHFQIKIYFYLKYAILFLFYINFIYIMWLQLMYRNCGTTEYYNSKSLWNRLKFFFYFVLEQLTRRRAKIVVPRRSKRLVLPKLCLSRDERAESKSQGLSV